VTTALLITFGDNDFARTLRAFGDLLLRHRDVYAEGFLTEVRVADLWNDLAPSLYLLAQNGGRFERTSPKDYLKIHYRQIYLGTAARQYVMANTSQWNHSWLYVDFEGHGLVEVV
jgi:hypothetical protein